MESTSYGSFCIACRLATALRQQPNREKRARTIASFMARYSTQPRHLSQLLKLLLCSVTAGGSAQSVDAEAAIRSVTGGGSATLTFASNGTLSIDEAVDFCKALRERRESIDAATIVRIAASCDTAEFKTLLSIAIGDRAAVIGGTGSEELLGVLGDAAVVAFKSSNGDVTAAVAVAMDGSPHAIVEAQPSMIEVADATGFVTPPPEPTVGVAPKPEPEMLFRRVSSAHLGPAAAPANAPAAAPQPKRERVEATVVATEDVLPTKVKRAELPPCKYGAGCIRKNPQHFKEFSHPAAGTAPTPTPPTAPAAAATAVAPAPVERLRIDDPRLPALPKPESQSINGVKPLRAMPEYEFVYVDGGGPAAGGHKMKNCGDGTYTCSCPVWRFQNRAANARTCKHLRAYLGDDFERARCGDDVVPGGPAGTAVGGPPMVAKKHPLSGVLLAESANPALGYEGWWISEKLDGVRAYWNGEVLLSRNGNEFTAPDWFVADLPKGVALDGELFGGRRNFQKTVGIVKSSAAHPGWRTLTYEIFDIPSSKEKPFEARVDEMKKLLSGKPAHIHIVEQRKCGGKADLDAALAAVEKLGGEGLMLRQPDSLYVTKRSTTLLKLKTMEDIDAIIRGYDRGKGRNEGRVGALIAELPNGKQFNCGSGLSDAQRDKPPAIGTVIVVRCQGLTDGGVPRFPVFAGCRYDIDWPPPPKH